MRVIDESPNRANIGTLTYTSPMLLGREPLQRRLLEALKAPGLTVLSGPPGMGKSAMIRAAANNFPQLRPGTSGACTGGGIEVLRHRAGLALARALRAPLPESLDDAVVFALSVADGRPVLLDDGQHCDQYSLEVALVLAKDLPVLIVVGSGDPAWQVTASMMVPGASTLLEVHPLSDVDAEQLVRRTNPGLADSSVAHIVRAGQGIPLALVSFAAADGQSVRRAMVGRLAGCSTAARTAMVAMGLLGRPVTSGLLGSGVEELIEAGLVQRDSEVDSLPSASFYRLAASLASPADRTRIHQRLASQVQDPVEAARHFAAAGNRGHAVATALGGCRSATDPTIKAELYALAAQNDDPARSRQWWRSAAAEFRRAGHPERAATAERRAVQQPLSTREDEVLRFLGAGLTNAAISRRLRISPETVEDHVASVLRKMVARNRTEAAVMALDFDGTFGTKPGWLD